jgi:hypothetical protein
VSSVDRLSSTSHLLMPNDGQVYWNAYYLRKLVGRSCHSTLASPGKIPVPTSQRRRNSRSSSTLTIWSTSSVRTIYSELGRPSIRLPMIRPCCDLTGLNPKLDGLRRDSSFRATAGCTDDADATEVVFGTCAHADHSRPCATFTRERLVELLDGVHRP